MACSKRVGCDDCDFGYDGDYDDDDDDQEYLGLDLAHLGC